MAVPISDISRRLVSSAYTSLLDLRAPCPTTAQRRSELSAWCVRTAQQLDALLQAARIVRPGCEVQATSRALDGALGSLREGEAAWVARLQGVGQVQGVEAGPAASGAARGGARHGLRDGH